MLYACKVAHTLFTSQRERDKERKGEREIKRERERERDKERKGEREIKRERERERDKERKGER